ncbi:sulfatase-like hydrolase/transferase [Zeaxanthinibacter enoshimensis]|uniref:sulfatase-like hydrolase/transferase n=1 Tax=Zeaxanthinibacter enoshimensis TaxID=392009 RepID=UPI003563FC82
MIAGITDKKLKEQRPLRDYIRMVLAFFICLSFISFWQQGHLYQQGLLDTIINKSLFLLLVHHTGFASLAGIILAFVFNLLEGVKRSFGLYCCGILFITLIFTEILTTLYFTEQHELLGSDFLEIYSGRYTTFRLILRLIIGLLSASLGFLLMYRLMARVYHHISRMYPFTLILLTIFLSTLMSHKNPVNENKTQHLLDNALAELLDRNPYEGEAEYPLLRPRATSTLLTPYFQLGEERPNIVILVVDGLGADFIGQGARYAAFSPFLNSLAESSLVWDNFLSNQGTSYAAIPSVTGSLPFGTRGFNKIEQQLNRHTLFSLLGYNGYRTSFNYGGNTALHNLDRFLVDEKTDEIIGRKNFGKNYSQQPQDDAGVSKGYPDKALFTRWHRQEKDWSKPRLDVFQTLSSSKPFLIPQQAVYEKKVEFILETGNFSKETENRISRNTRLFSSVRYMDDAISHFIRQYKSYPQFDNTIFIITGSHNLTELPQENNLDRYRVPLLVYSPLINAPRRFQNMASHADIVPSVLDLIDQHYGLDLPSEVAWLGEGLLDHPDRKTIPLFRYQNSIEDFIMGSHFTSNGQMYKIGPSLELAENYNKEAGADVETAFQYFKAVNRYVTMENKLIPPAQPGLYTSTRHSFSKEEMIWLQSVFNGVDFDNAYKQARQIAFDGDWDRADLLCRFILDKVPGHADTEILRGRLAAWQGKYEPAEKILSEAVRKYPVYSDAYAALLDTYFWNAKHREALELQPDIIKYHPENIILQEKLQRASSGLKKQLVQERKKAREDKPNKPIAAKT